MASTVAKAVRYSEWMAAVQQLEELLPAGPRRVELMCLLTTYGIHDCRVKNGCDVGQAM